jgi:subtilase family serine protease
MRNLGSTPESLRFVPVFEALESRTLLSAVVLAIDDLGGLVACPAVNQPDRGGGSGKPASGATYTPAQIRAAYGITGDGAGQTIAIVDAYDDPNIVADLKAFDAKYGLSDPILSVVYQGGSKPVADSGWALEISLDVEWAHAVAPMANILLVEAQTNSFNDLLAAVDLAVGQGASVVSMSWGSAEFSGETSYDSHFAVPGVTFVASSGDKGAVVEWPAISPNVLSVGGTTLTLSGGTYGSESAWSGSGGGVSRYELKPTYQSQVTQSKTMRTNPDVAYNADPNTGFAVYDSYGYGGWLTVGGTSAGAPQWAALVAIADQARLQNLGSVDTLTSLYTMPSGNFHDITSGTAGKNRAGPGYDLATGLGSPFAGRVISALATAPAASLTVGAAPVDLSGTALGLASGLAEADGPVSGEAPSASPAPEATQAEPAAADVSYASPVDAQASVPADWKAVVPAQGSTQDIAAAPVTFVPVEYPQASITDLSVLPVDLLQRAVKLVLA